MKKIILMLLLLCALPMFSQAPDIYGGVAAVTCPNAVPTDWTMQTLTLGGKQHRVFCDPLHHPYIKRGVYYMVPESSSTSTEVPLTNASYLTSKYAPSGLDSDFFFNNAVARIKSWGFNATGPGSVRNAYDSGITNKVPYSAYVGWRIVDKCMTQGGMCKNLDNALWPSANPNTYTNYIVDAYDPAYNTWTVNAFAGDVNMTHYKNDPYFAVGVSDDTDYYKTLSSGGDFTTDYAGQNSGHTIWYIAQSAPHITVNRHYQNAVYSDTTNYSKANLATFLTTRYGTITALNSAWGSGYTSFGTAGAAVTGTSLTGSGIGPYGGTLTRTTGIDKFSITIKKDSAAVSGDNGGGVIVGPGMWTASATNLVRTSGNVVTLTVNRTLTGVISAGSTITILGLDSRYCRADYAIPTSAVTVSAATSNTIQYTWAGDVPGAIPSCVLSKGGAWGPAGTFTTVMQIARTSNVATYTTQNTTPWIVGDFVTVAEIPSGQCSGLSAGFNLATVAITAKPDSTHFSVASTGTNLTTCDVGSGAIAPAGLVNYSTGAVSGLYFDTAPASTVTADYWHDGWGIGGGFLDEAGPTISGHTYYPTSDITLSGANSAMKLDFEDYLAQWTGKMFQVQADAFHAIAPTKLFGGISNIGGWRVPGRCGHLKGAAAALDLLQIGGFDGSQAQADFIGQCTNDKPFTMWESVLAQGDSQWYDISGGAYAGATWYTANQAARATYFQNDMNNFWNVCNSVSGVCSWVGYDWWAYYDYSYSEKLSFGLVTWRDNAYDGVEAKTGTHACSAPDAAYTCGGEVNNYGNFLGPVTTTNFGFDSFLAGGVGSSTPSSIRGITLRGVVLK